MTAAADPGPEGDGARELAESERIEREEFARGHVEPGEEPVEPRPAATMVLARPGERDSAEMELLFLRRPDTSRFAAGAWVFPGGVVDPADREAGLEERLGPGVTREEPAALVAALREGFEETGLLPSDDRPALRATARARERLLAGEIDFATVVRRLDVEFRGLRAAYFARWITPPRLSRRYDARFFLVRHRGGEARPVHGEHTEARWLAPADAAGRFEAGDFPMLYPTRKTVEALAELGSLAEAFRVFRERTVEAVRPRLLVEGEAVKPVLPGDRRYEEAGRQLREGGPGPGGDAS